MRARAAGRCRRGCVPRPGRNRGRVEPRHDVGSRSAISSRCERQNRRRSVACVFQVQVPVSPASTRVKRCRRQRRQPTVQHGHRSEPCVPVLLSTWPGRLVPDEQCVLRHRRRRGPPFGSGRRSSATKLRPITVQRRPWQWRTTAPTARRHAATALRRWGANPPRAPRSQDGRAMSSARHCAAGSSATRHLKGTRALRTACRRRR